MELKKILENYGKSGALPMHMPGHKRRLPADGLPWNLDITEISGFDNLHEASGILKSAMERAAAVFGAERSFFLVNGSTAGVLAGVCASARRGDTVLMARGCHRSVYNAVELRGLVPQFITAPQLSFGAYAPVSADAVRAALARCADAKLLIVTCPTYEGAVCDLRAIVDAAHEAGVPVLADAAHGSHFGFSPAFPESAVRSGADMVVHGLHKTLPSLTQTALLHFRRGFVDENELERQLSVFQTSSPSYPLMAAIDGCVGLLAEKGGELFAAYKDALEEFDERVKRLKHLCVFCHGSDKQENHPELYDFDPGKIVIISRGADITGTELFARLRDGFGIELEMAAGVYVLAMTSVCDTGRTLMRLADALLEIDEGLKCAPLPSQMALPGVPKRRLLPEQARYAPGELLCAEKAEGRISGCMLWAYPPGIPLIIPGEEVSRELTDFMGVSRAQGVAIHGENGAGEDKIWVLCD